MLKTNYHTHTTFCDGKASPEEVVLSAIKKNFDILGFSGHSIYPFASDWTMPPQNMGLYIDTINDLKKKYSSQIELYAGFEADFIEGVSTPDMKVYSRLGADYILGAVHYVTSPHAQGFFEADGNFEEVRNKIKELYKGDSRAAVCQYFECERNMLEKGNFTFMAHPDLIRKQNSSKNSFGPLFDEEDSWYKNEVKATADKIAQAGVCVEVNTGGIARGYLDQPYPSPYFLGLLKERNVSVTINSDSHNPDTLDTWFPEALEYIKKAGYTEVMLYKSGKLVAQKL